MPISRFLNSYQSNKKSGELYIQVVGCSFATLGSQQCYFGLLRFSSHQTRPDKTRPDQTRPDQTKPDQKMSQNIFKCHKMSRHLMVDRPDQTRPDQNCPRIKKNKKKQLGHGFTLGSFLYHSSMGYRILGAVCPVCFVHCSVCSGQWKCASLGNTFAEGCTQFCIVFYKNFGVADLDIKAHYFFHLAYIPSRNHFYISHC